MKNIYVNLVDVEARWTIGLLRYRDRAVRVRALAGDVVLYSWA